MGLKLEEGRRVYVPSTKTFGTIVRQGGILGLKSSFAIVDDLGKKSMFLGDNIEFVYVDSSQTIKGTKVEIPQDVVPILRQKLTPTDARKKTVDLYNLSPEDRERECANILCTNNQENKPEDKRPVTRKSKRSSKKS